MKVDRPAYTLIAATVLAVLYVLTTWYLFRRFVGDNEVGWQRALLLYNGVASVGFTAIGVLLGTSVQQHTVMGARADAARAEADATKKEAAIKAALARVSAPAAGQPGDLGGGPPDEDSRREAVRLALLEGLN